MMRPGIGLVLCITLLMVSCASPTASTNLGTLVASSMLTTTPTRMPPKLEGTEPVTGLAYPEGYMGQEWISPNGEWVVWELCCNLNVPYVKVQRLDGAIYWDVYNGNEQAKDWGDVYIIPIFWSSDERYLFLQVPPPGHGLAHYGISTIGLFRLDLHNGEIKTVQEVDISVTCEGGFSISGNQWAYICRHEQPLVIHLLDLESLTERSLHFEQLFEYAYGVVWSPDETKIAIVLMNCPIWKIVVIDISLESAEEVLGDSDGNVEECLYIDWYRAIYQPAKWLSDEELLLDIPYSESPPQVLNIVSGELQPAEE